MAEPAHQKRTYADLLAAARPDRASPELMDGRIVYRASPRFAHSRAQRRLGVALDPVDSNGGSGWWILVEPHVRFGPHTVLLPDLAGWRRERLPSPVDGAIEVVPDWVCEILSPGHENHDRVDKMGIYLEAGVPWLWFVHPEERRLEVFERREQGDGWWYRAGLSDGVVEPIPPFDELEIDVGALFVPRDDVPEGVAEPVGAYRAYAT